MTSKRLTIINGIVSHLNGITVAGGFHYNVTNAEHNERILFGEPAGEFPIVDVVPGSGAFDNNACSDVDSTFIVTVRCAVASTTPSGINLPGAENIMADVKNRLMDWSSSSTLEPAVIEIVPISEAIDDGMMYPSICEVTFRVSYRYNWADA